MDKDEKIYRLLLNSIRTPDGTVLTSRHVHDYVTHKDDNGLTYMVDGGLGYLRRNVHSEHPYEELSLYENDDFELLRTVVTWGARDGKRNIYYIPIKQMSKAHINNIISDGYTGAYVDLMKRELEHREDNESYDEAILMELQRERSYG